MRFTPSKRLTDLRKCHACHALLFRVNTDRQPWTLLVLMAILLPIAVMPAVAVWLLPELGWGSILVGLSGIVIAQAINYLQFPFTNGYVVWYPECRDCGYDMRQTEGNCPECGGVARRHPEDGRNQVEKLNP